jgi:hypothetical protein
MRPVRTVLCVIVALGCASDPENTLAPGYEGAPGAKRFIVCAPNTMIALPAELQDATGALHEQIDAYIHFHEREAKWLDLLDSKRLWTEAVAAGKAQGAIEKAPALFAAQLAKTYQFDAIVLPSIILHKTRVTDNYGSWDGVERQMQMVNAPKRATGRAQDWQADAIHFGGVTGDVLVTSVHVLVFSREGERIFEGRGGIGFVQDIDITAKKHTWAFRPRNPIVDVDALREGIAIAFHPYLTQPDE